MTQVEAEQILLQLEGGTLRFDRNGDWWQGDVPVTHPGVAQYFSRHMHWSDQLKQYVVSSGKFCVAVDVADTPFVITAVNTESLPWMVELSNARIQAMCAETLAIDADGVWYCRQTPEADGQTVIVRLLRNAAQALWPFVEELTEQPGKFAIRCGAELLPIASRK